jgi:hypothetical protein
VYFFQSFKNLATFIHCILWPVVFKVSFGIRKILDRVCHGSNQIKRAEEPQ